MAVRGRGILITNLGSPQEPTPDAVKAFLKEFLGDPSVITMPKMVRLPLVNLIARLRSRSSSSGYAEIWESTGSPLLVHTHALAKRVGEQTDLPVAVGMRYGQPSLEYAREELTNRCDEIMVISPYPQFAASTYQSQVVELQRIFQNSSTKVFVKEPYFNDADFIDVLSNLIRTNLQDDVDHLLFSFHGLPEQHIRSADSSKSHCLKNEACCETPHPSHATCYRHQCRYLASKLCENLDIETSIAFQSRLGPANWLRPYTLQSVQALAAQGIRKLAVACPSFISDNIETLFEIGHEVRDAFLKSGGDRLDLIPCLNESDGWVRLVSEWALSDSSSLVNLNHC